jgi:signal transduction histidine kinase
MTRSRRRLWLLLVGVVITVAVVFGVTTSLQRERLLQRDRLASFLRAADVVVGIVEESLEELRERESARPFDHYNPVYAPEGVLAASDALAPSPLARAPDDVRLQGWVQLNPDGTITLPFDDTRPAVAADVRQLASSAAFAPLRGLTRPPAPPRLALANEAQRPSSSSSSSSSSSMQGYGTKQGIVQQLNEASSNVYSQLKEAEPEPQKRAALASNQKLPQVKREDVDWGEDTLGTLGTKARPSSKRSKKAVMMKGDLDGYAKQEVLPEAPTPPAPPPPEQAPESVQARGPDGAGSVAVSYTPMVFDELPGGVRVLHRTVTSTADGARTVQAVLLNSEALRGWLLGVIGRRVDDSEHVELVDSAAQIPCAVRAPVSGVLDGLELCFSSTTAPSSSVVEIAVLLGLLVLVIAVLLTLDRAAERAEVLARQRAAFITAVSHELRTPLTTLRMHAELLRDGLVTDADKVRKFHTDMVQESVRLSHLVENVLEAQRLEEGRRPLRLVSTDVGGLVRSVVEGQRPLIAARNFSVAIEVKGTSLEGSVDQQAVEQMVVNLVENAVKYAAVADRRIDVGVHRRGDDAVITVADHGPGIPAEERQRVFARFARVQRPGDEHIAGTGLGLALVRELAVAHGGSARIVPRPDGADGCCVAVTLPLRPGGG